MFLTAQWNFKSSPQKCEFSNNYPCAAGCLRVQALESRAKLCSVCGENILDHHWRSRLNRSVNRHISSIVLLVWILVLRYRRLGQAEDDLIQLIKQKDLRVPVSPVQKGSVTKLQEENGAAEALATSCG